VREVHRESLSADGDEVARPVLRVPLGWTKIRKAVHDRGYDAITGADHLFTKNPVPLRFCGIQAASPPAEPVYFENVENVPL
jgi:hypothetical protein